LIVAAILLAACVAISGRSLWIDEACTAMKALPTTLSGWWQALSGDRSADLQMPLYMFYVWGWARIFGAGEWSLHAANAPWFIGGALAFVFAFPAGDRRRFAAAAAVILCPFAWYYLDEARPYTMQLGASLLLLASLLRLARSVTPVERVEPPVSSIEHGTSNRLEAAGVLDLAAEGAGFPPGTGSNVLLYLLGLVVLSGSSLLGMVWAGAALLTVPAVLSIPRTIGLARRYWYLWIAAGAFLLLFTGYYLWTLSLGARASASATTTVGSAMFIGYELLGFSGLGPGRLELRTAGAGALRSSLPWLALYAAAVAVLIGAALWQLLRTGNRRHVVLAFCCVLPAAFILAVGWVAHFRVLGRHFTPLLSILLLIFALGLAALGSRSALWARGAVFVFCALSLASCLSLRFALCHEKDNYRAAAAAARQGLSRGQLVWWNAAEEGARYYQVPLATRPGSAGAAVLVLNPVSETLKTMPTPQLVVASKPDVYDGQSALSDYLKANGFNALDRFTAFVIWERGTH
jgi:hypothetical protein